MKAFEIDRQPDAALKNIATFLFEQKGFGGLFALVKKNTGEYAYALITDKNKIDFIVPSFPLMPANAGKLISRLTIIEATKRPVAVILRPCELRALYELVKLEQAHLDNLLFISYTCNGVFTLGTKNNGLEQRLPEYWEKAKTGELVPGIRECCTICEDFIPENADIILALAGNDTAQKTAVFLKSPKGEDALKGITANISEKNLASTEIETIQRRRAENKQRVFAELKTEELGWTGLIKLLGRCIQCRACGSACPLCFCKLCYIDSPEKEMLPLLWEQELNRTGSLRIPDETVMYHLVRMLHVGAMCVGCGMCSDACPTSIPIATVFAKIGGHIQDAIDYTPGKDLDQKMPLTILNPEDFAEKNSPAGKK